MVVSLIKSWSSSHHKYTANTCNCNHISNGIKQKTRRVGPVDNRPSTKKDGGPKQLCGKNFCVNIYFPLDANFSDCGQYGNIIVKCGKYSNITFWFYSSVAVWTDLPYWSNISLILDSTWKAGPKLFGFREQSFVKCSSKINEYW